MKRIVLDLGIMRRALLIDEGFIGVSAVLGGTAIAMGLVRIPADWVDNLPEPLTNTSILGLCLALVVGGSCLGALAVVLVSRSHRAAYASVCCALVVLVWMFVEAVDLGPATWLEPLYSTMTGLLAVLAYAYMWLSLSADEEMAGGRLPVTRASRDRGAVPTGTGSAATRE